MKVYWLSAYEVKHKILSQELKVEEVIQIILERIKEVEEKINAFVTVCEKEALQKAKEVNRKIVEGKRVGLLAGIPIAIKDNISTKNIRTTCSSKMLENYIPPFNATVIEKVLAEDAIIIGKTNMDEFAMGTTTETSFFSPTKNPWDLTRVPGGSSGGSAAALAAGEIFLALGSDTGGSIRCPASFCGVVGLKPTYGLVSRYGLIAYANTFEQIGPMARTTIDCALLLTVIAGWDWKDSTSVKAPPKDYVKSLDENIKGLKVGIPKEMIAEGVDKKIVKAIFDYLFKLEELGVEWEEFSLPALNYALPAYYLIAMSEASSNLARFDGIRYGYRFTSNENLDWNDVFSKSRKEGFGAEVKRRIILGTYALSAGYYGRFFLKSLKTITLIKKDFEEAFKRFDVLVGPTMPVLPFKLGEKINDPLALYLCDIDTVPANLVGIPAITFPCSFYDELPIGVQVMGAPFKEDLILRVAYTSEKILQLNKIHPNL